MKRLIMKAHYTVFAVLLMACAAEATNDGQSDVRLSPEERAAYVQGVVDTLTIEAIDEAHRGDPAATLLLECNKERAPGYSAVQKIAEDLLKIDPEQPMPVVISGALGAACSRVLPANDKPGR